MVMSFAMEKLKEALLMMMNFGGQVLQMMLNFVGQLLLKLVNFAGEGLLSLKNFSWQVLVSLLNFFGQVPLTLKNFCLQALITLKNFGSQVLLSLQNIFGQVPLMLKNFGWQVLVMLKELGGQALVTLKNFGGQALVALDNITWQVKNLFGRLVNWFDEVFPPETRVEKINYWFHVALPYLIIALFLALFIYCCYTCVGLLLPRVGDLLKTVWNVVIKILKCLFTCCWRSKEPIIKMMKAPGRNIIIPRSAFEINPRLYFINLRTYPGDMLV